MSTSGKASIQMTDVEWRNLKGSVTSLRCAVIALIVVITLFCVVQVVAIVYKFSVMRRNSRERKIEQMRRAIAEQKVAKRRRSKSSGTSSKRKRTKKYRKTKTAEPSKKLMVQLSLSHDDDQPEECREKSSDQTDEREASANEENMIPDGQAKGDFPPENRYTSRKMDAIGTNISPGKNVGNANLVAQDSLMMVGDQKLFPVELSSSSNLLKEKKTNEKVSKAVEMMKGQNDNLFPDDKQGLSSTKSSGSKSGDNSSDSSPSKQSSTKGPAVIEIPETATASNSSASTAKEENLSTANKTSEVPATKPADVPNEGSKPTKSSDGTGTAPTAPVRGKVLEFTIGV